MKKIIVIFLLVFSFACSVKKVKYKKKGQFNYLTYYPVIYKADSLFYAKRYNESFRKLDSLFKKNKKINILEEQQLYIKVAHLSNQNINYKKKFKDLIENFYFKKEYYDSSFISILNKYVTSKEYFKWKKKFNKKIIIGLDDTLINMNISDQKFRNEKYNSYSFQKKRDSIDSINENRLIKIFEVYGYPNSSNHKMSYKTTVSTILLHTSDSIRMHYFVPKILKFVKNGNCSPMVYANLIDQYHLYKGEKQVYNSYITNKATKYDTVQTELLRKKIGLPKSISLNLWIGYNELIRTLDSVELENHKSFLKLYEKNIFK